MSGTQEAAVAPADSEPVDGFDTPDGFDPKTDAAQQPTVKKKDPARPEAIRGRYKLPEPRTGKTASWQRVTNFVKLTDDTYHLELWKQRNVAKGVAMLAADRPASFLTGLAAADVKLDRERLNNIATSAQEIAEAYRMADEGTALHTSTELADYAGGKLTAVPSHHRPKVSLYLGALALNGLKVVPGMIERVTVSTRYETAGKFDRVYELAGGGGYVIGDLKTGDSLDLSFPSIAAQLDCYRDGINEDGIWDGSRYDTSIRVRDDFGIVVHLPSTRDEVMVYRVDLAQGRLINEGNLHIKQVRKIKAKHVSEVYAPTVAPMTPLELHAYWLEQLNAQITYQGLTLVAQQARGFGQWNERLANQARVIAAELAAEAQLSAG